MNKSSKSNKSGGARRTPKARKSAQPKKQKNLGNQPKFGLSRNVEAPIAQGKVSVMSRPQTRNLPNGDIVIRHREYIRDIIGHIGFDALTLAINPGLPNIFPWLSNIAPNYESYIFENLEFDYETQAPTVASGTVVLAIDYDPEDLAPVSKTQAMAYRGSVRCPTWSSSQHKSLKEDLVKRKTYFVRHGILLGGEPVNTYDTGHLNICTQGQADNSVIGELYVSYSIKLMTPQLGNPAVGNAIYGRFTGNTAATMFDNMTGNIDVSVDHPDNDSVLFTFNRDWEGYMAVGMNGTVFTSPPVVVDAGSTVNFILTNTVVNTALTNSVSMLNITAFAGQTLLLIVSNGTVTGSTATFGQANVAPGP
jgi:hypothetical protein